MATPRDHFRAVAFALFIVALLGGPQILSRLQLFAFENSFTSNETVNTLTMGALDGLSWSIRVAVLCWLFWRPLPQTSPQGSRRFVSSRSALVISSLIIGRAAILYANDYGTDSTVSSALVTIADVATAGVLIAAFQTFRRFTATDMDATDDEASNAVRSTTAPWSIRGMMVCTLIIAASMGAHLYERHLYNRRRWFLVEYQWVYSVSYSVFAALLAIGLGLALTRTSVLRSFIILYLTTAAAGLAIYTGEFLAYGETEWTSNLISAATALISLLLMSLIARRLGYQLT